MTPASVGFCLTTQMTARRKRNTPALSTCPHHAPSIKETGLKRYNPASKRPSLEIPNSKLQTPKSLFELLVFEICLVFGDWNLELIQRIRMAIPKSAAIGKALAIAKKSTLVLVQNQRAFF